MTVARGGSGGWGVGGGACVCVCVCRGGNRVCVNVCV